MELLNELEWPALSRDVSRLVAASDQLTLTVQPAGDSTALADPAQQSDSEDAGSAEEETNLGDEGDLEDGGSDSEDEDGVEDVDAVEGGDSSGDSEGNDEDEKGEAAGGDEALPERPRAARSVVDDQFFRLGELEQFLERQDRQFERERQKRPADEDEEGGMDLFTETAGDEQGTRRPDHDGDDMAMFADFFDPPEDTKSAPGKAAKAKKLV